MTDDEHALVANARGGDDVVVSVGEREHENSVLSREWSRGVKNMI